MYHIISCFWKGRTCIPKCLKISSFNDNLYYDKHNDSTNENSNFKRKRKYIICFNPPCLGNWVTNFGKAVFKICKKNFSKNHKTIKTIVHFWRCILSSSYFHLIMEIARTRVHFRQPLSIIRPPAMTQSVQITILPYQQ